MDAPIDAIMECLLVLVFGSMNATIHAMYVQGGQDKRSGRRSQHQENCIQTKKSEHVH